MSDLEDSDVEFFYSSSDDDDEIFFNIPRTNNEGYLEHIVPLYEDTVCFEHFRVSKAVAINMGGRFEQIIHFNAQPGPYENVSAFHQMLIFLWYPRHQTTSFRDTADRFDIAISALHKIIGRVTMFLSNISPLVIVWPTEEEKVEIEEQFRANGFSNIIGVIDGSHIKIDKPSEDADSYVNRKGYYSIQLQVVCDNRRKIRDVCVGFPGSVHDPAVILFRNSALSGALANKCGAFFLLGDSGYPLKPNLLTPIRDRGHLTPRQTNYNVTLSRSLYVIEHCFGILKQKFRQLYHIKLRNVRMITHLIRAACVVHNFAIEDEFIVNEALLGEQQLAPNDNNEENIENRDAIQIRNNVAENLPM